MLHATHEVKLRLYKPGEAIIRQGDPVEHFYIVSDGSAEPYRVRIKSPVFNNLRTLTPLVTGGKLADIPAVMGSIDLCVGDLDR